MYGRIKVLLTDPSVAGSKSGKPRPIPNEMEGGESNEGIKANRKEKAAQVCSNLTSLVKTQQAVCGEKHHTAEFHMSAHI